MINIKATDEEKQEVREVSKKITGQENIAGFFWYCVNYFKRKR